MTFPTGSTRGSRAVLWRVAVDPLVGTISDGQLLIPSYSERTSNSESIGSVGLEEANHLRIECTRDIFTDVTDS